MANVNRGPITPRPRTASGMDWDDVWADAVHSHASNAEGGQLDHGAALTGLIDDDHPQYKLRSGVEVRTATLSYAAGVFTVTPPGGGFNVWTGGVKWPITTARTVALDTNNTLYYVYFDTDGVLKIDTGAWDISGNAAPIAIVFRVSAALAAIGDERHNEDRNRDLHSWAHNTIGARYDAVHGGLTGTFGDTTFTITHGQIWDEDLVHEIAQATACRIWYRSGASAMIFLDNQTVPYVLNGANLRYDNAGVLADAANNYYVCYYVYGTNDIDYPIYVQMGQGQHVNVTNARNEAAPVFAGLTTAEWKLLYKLVFRNTGGVAPTYTEALDFRLASGVATSFAPVAHASLTGLGADDHEQYLLADGTRVAVELRLTPKSASTGPEGTIFYCSDDDCVYVGTEV